jgi:polysaccharide deacetylase 2 family uncharacterized protein YibQ
VKKEKKYRLAVIILSAVIVLQALFILLSRPKRERPLVPRPAGKIAVVIDDWGYNMECVYPAAEINYPLTVAVLPNLPYSRPVAQELHQAGKEVILHLPMQPAEKYRLEKNTVTASMSEKQIKDILSKDLANIVYARGVSNHMGSLATADSATMEIIFKELKKRHLYFLDSLVTAKSFGSYWSRRTGLPFARRDIFLDNINEPAYIMQQVGKLKKMARNKGQAVGIGHARNTTLALLKEAMPKLEKEGFKFVFVSELAQ